MTAGQIWGQAWTNSRNFSNRNPVVVLVLLVFVALNQDTSFAAKIPSTSSKSVLNDAVLDNSAYLNLGVAALRQFLSPTVSFPRVLFSLIRFFIQNFLSEKWNTDVAIKRLDTLKSTLISFYSTRVEKQGRDKGIGFPSLEGALLSLAFLTFSVILIDFIQTLLSRLRVTPAVATATRAPATVFAVGRQFLGNFTNMPTELGSRNMTHDEMMTTLSSKILSAIEKPISSTARVA